MMIKYRRAWWWEVINIISSSWLQPVNQLNFKCKMWLDKRIGISVGYKFASFSKRWSNKLGARAWNRGKYNNMWIVVVVTYVTQLQNWMKSAKSNWNVLLTILREAWQQNRSTKPIIIAMQIDYFFTSLLEIRWSDRQGFNRNIRF